MKKVGIRRWLEPGGKKEKKREWKEDAESTCSLVAGGEGGKTRKKFPGWIHLHVTSQSWRVYSDTDAFHGGGHRGVIQFNTLQSDPCV